MMRDRLVVGVLAAAPLIAVVAAGCHHERSVPIGSPDKAHPALAGKSLAALTRLVNRRQARGKLYLSVTLWTRAYVEAFVRDVARKRGWDAKRAAQLTAQLVDKYVRGRTAFRVQLEALDRPLTLKGTDPVLDLAQWRWELWTSKGTRIPVRSVTVDMKQLFRTTSTGYSWRIQGNIDFPFPLSPPTVDWIELEAVPPTGKAAFRLHWRIRR